MTRSVCAFIILLVLFAGAAALAGAPPAPSPAPPAAAKPSVLQWLADNPFSATLVFLILATLIGSFVSRLARDRCLKDFEGYPVTLDMKDGQRYHGELDVEKTGLEFHYERTTPQGGIRKTSFLIFQPEYKGVHALLRYHDRLSEAQMKVRGRAARKAYHPSLLRRWARAVRNFFAGIKDSMLEAFTLAMGRMKSIQAAAPVMQSGGKYIDRVGKETIGTASDVTYDPLLEKQIGLRVVLELPQDSALQDECVGTFREYTKNFFALMDVDYESQWDVVLAGPGAAAFVRGIAAQRQPNGVRLENCSTFAVELCSAVLAPPPAQEGEEPAPAPTVALALPVTIGSGENLEFALPSRAAGLTLTFHTRRRADLIVPRTGAFVRHKNEWVRPRKLVGELTDAVGLLPGTSNVVSVLKQGASLVSLGTGKPSLLPFVKMHGCGNDYIYLDCRERVLERPEALARRLSDRHFGIGSDGIVLVLPSERADFRMRMYNSDGSEAEMCGNGLRGFAKYLFDRGMLTGNEARIETGAGVLRVWIFAEEGTARRVRVNMGQPRLERGDIPVAGPPGQAIDQELTIEVPHEGNVALRYTAVSMGNPHCVTYVDNVDACPVAVHGPLVENHRLFPKRTNVEFVQVLARDELKMRVWERGAGETLACGTGASAILVASVLNGKTDRKAVVHLLGGDLDIEWADDGCVYLTGPAEEVFEGTVAI